MASNRALLITAFFLIILDVITGVSSIVAPGSSYSMNFQPKASGANALNQNVPASMQFCTGVSSGPLVTSGTHQILVTYTWNAASVNITGQVLQINFKIGTTAPATIFQSGNCASVGVTQLGVSGLYLAVTGAANIFSAVFVGSSSQPAGTYYAWMDFQAKTQAVKLDSFGATSFVTMLEVK